MTSREQRLEFLRAADHYAPMVARILGGADRDGSYAEDIRHDLARDLSDPELQKAYFPVVVPDVPEQIARLRLPTQGSWLAREALHKELARMSMDNLRLFVAYRNTVTECEATNAQRLHLLASSALASRNEDVILSVAGFLSQHWKRHQRFSDKTVGELREWSQAQTRDYEKLPISWRYADLPTPKAMKEARDDRD